jgi:hypothetical protein
MENGEIVPWRLKALSEDSTFNYDELMNLGDPNRTAGNPFYLTNKYDFQKHYPLKFSSIRFPLCLAG